VLLNIYWISIHHHLRLLCGLSLLLRASFLRFGLLRLQKEHDKTSQRFESLVLYAAVSTYDPDKVVQRQSGKHVKHAVRDEDSKVSPGVRVRHVESRQEYVGRLKLAELAILRSSRVEQVSPSAADVVSHIGSTSCSSSRLELEVV
jgi:hypothetical protein